VSHRVSPIERRVDPYKAAAHMGGPQQIKLELFSTRWLEQAARSLTSTDGNVALLSVGIRNEIIGVAMHRLSDSAGATANSVRWQSVRV
jgi:hypothetical protein